MECVSKLPCVVLALFPPLLFVCVYLCAYFYTNSYLGPELKKARQSLLAQPLICPEIVKYYV